MTKEPVAIAAIVVAILNVVALIVLKRELSVEEQTAVVTVVTLIGAGWVRSKVTPVA
jgi:hypothetical protein